MHQSLKSVNAQAGFDRKHAWSQREQGLEKPAVQRIATHWRAEPRPMKNGIEPIGKNGWAHSDEDAMRLQGNARDLGATRHHQKAPLPERTAGIVRRRSLQSINNDLFWM
jgi:hypothetical protein